MTRHDSLVSAWLHIGKCLLPKNLKKTPNVEELLHEMSLKTSGILDFVEPDRVWHVCLGSCNVFAREPQSDPFDNRFDLKGTCSGLSHKSLNRSMSKSDSTDPISHTSRAGSRRGYAELSPREEGPNLGKAARLRSLSKAATTHIQRGGPP